VFFTENTKSVGREDLEIPFLIPVRGLKKRMGRESKKNKFLVDPAGSKT